MTYSEKLKDPRWQKKRLEVLQRENFTCQVCGAKDMTLHVHHLVYHHAGPWETPSEYLECLCEMCHGARTESDSIDIFQIRCRPSREVLNPETLALYRQSTGGRD